MNKKILLCSLMVMMSYLLTAQVRKPSVEKVLKKGMIITGNTKIKKALYKIDADYDPGQPIILIDGYRITVDFNNATLQGSSKQKDPDGFFGVAIIISSNSSNVTIKNLKAKGYKVALLAKNVTSLTLENCDLSYNYRQHLNSTQEKEDISDWMSYHHNENDEWLRYGAAIYLRSCNMPIIRNCRVSGGQNALMMTNCNDGLIVNNDFSFNSGVGIGMYRCSYNEVAYNRIDFNVRGYSHGVYNRGQDSAGILVYEQSNNNLFYKNSITHSGDGFFLWAGQTTMDTGEGGCNDNIISGNDFSYAPTNGVEVTFSRNKILKNRIFECDNGIWAGYSYNTDKLLKIDSTVSHIDSSEDESLLDKFSNDTAIIEIPYKNTIDPFKGRGVLNGRKNILMTEWGPYDFLSPIIWNTNPTDSSGTMQFDIKGPKGTWKIKSYKGVDTLSAKTGILPASVTAKKSKGERTDIDIELEYVGEQLTSPFGETVQKGRPYVFSFKKFFQPVDWSVNWFNLDTAAYDPIKAGELFQGNVKMRPAKEEKTQMLDYAWWGGIKTDKGQLPQFITLAEGSGNFQKGEYEIGVTWDDAVRVYVDNHLVIDEWNPSKYVFDESPHENIKLDLQQGMHTFSVEHVELGGFATL